MLQVILTGQVYIYIKKTPKTNNNNNNNNNNNKIIKLFEICTLLEYSTM